MTEGELGEVHYSVPGALRFILKYCSLLAVRAIRNKGYDWPFFAVKIFSYTPGKQCLCL
jgi:hypothetical protein